jgi:hypothetical protein
MKHFIFFILTIFFLPVFASAEMIITEIMYDPSGADSASGKNKEWVEIYNNGTGSVSITSAWRFVENNSRHTVEAVDISAGNYAVIVDDKDTFLAQYPSFAGIVIDSSFSLSNTGTTVSIRDAEGVDLDTVTYASSQGASGDGKTLQKGQSGWGVGNPTPGTMNVLDDAGSSNSNQNQSNASTTDNTNTNTTTNTSSQNQTTNKTTNWYSHSSQSEAVFGGDEIDFSVVAGRDRLVFTGAPVVFEAKVKKPQNVNLSNVNFSWSMGDGTETSGSYVTHTYRYPGEYSVVLNATYRAERAVARFKVKVLEPKIAITEANKDFIEILNTDKFEANVGMWTIENGQERFIIPNDTIIAPGVSVKIPTVVTKLSTVGRKLNLLNPSASVVASQGGVGMVAGDFEMMIADAPSLDVLEKKLKEALIFYGKNKSPAIPSVSVIQTIKPVSLVEKPVISTQTMPTSTPSTTLIFTVEKPKQKSIFKKLFGR